MRGAARMRATPEVPDIGAATPLAGLSTDPPPLAVRPTDFAAWQGALAPELAAGKIKALTVAVLAHVLIGVGVFGWHESGGFAVSGEDEIPVEIVVETAAQGGSTDVSSRPDTTAAAPAPPEPAEPTAMQGEAQPEATSVAAAPAAPAPNDADDKRLTMAALAPPPAAPAVDAALAGQAARKEAEAARRRREDQEHARRIEREKRAQARQTEREAVAREQRAEARRAAAAQSRESAAQERRRVASLGQSGGAGETRGDAFDAAAYSQIIKRAVIAAVARACPHGGGGRVVVALKIGAAGQIAAASMSASSGDGAIDSAAVAAVRRAGPFPAPAGRSSVSVPVAVTCK